MFRDRGAREREQIAAELRPYHDMVADDEVEQRLNAIDTDLAYPGKHLLSSNDRYQTGAAYLVAARNEFILADTIAKSFTDPHGPEDFHGQAFDQDALKQFLLGLYEQSREHLESADAIASQLGYTITDDVANELTSLDASIRWPGAKKISRRFLAGGIDAVDALLATATSQSRAIQAADTLTPAYKQYFDSKLQPTLAEVDNQRRAIDRLTSGGILTIQDESIMRELYQDIKTAITHLQEAGVFLTIPQLYDKALRPRNPLEEDRPGEKKFNPKVLGSPVVRRTIQPSRPARPAKPFDPGVLGTSPAASAPVTPRPAAPAHPFDPSILHGPASSEPAANPQPTREEHPFDPGILEHTQPTVHTQDRAPAQHPEHSFDPSILEEPSPEAAPPAARPEHPFDPGILNPPAQPPASKPFDPSILERHKKSDEEDEA